MTITALIPTKNRAKLLKRAIHSVLDQSFSDVKVLVRDNCSTDETSQLVRDLLPNDNRIIYNRLDNDIGAHENFRQGIRDIKTEYFSILGDDDYLERDFYSNAIKLFEENPDASFVVFSVDMVDIEGRTLFNNGNFSKDCINPRLRTGSDGIRNFLNNQIPANWTGYVFKKEVANEIDLGECHEVGYGADIFFIWHAACRFKFVVTNIKGGSCTIHENTTSNTLVKAFDERFLYWWRNRILLILRDNKVEPVVREIIEAFYFINVRSRYSDKAFYLRAAFSLVSKRIAANEEKDLRFDFIAMRSFLPAYMLFLVKYLYLPLDKMGLIAILRNLTVSCRDGLRKVLSS